MRLFVGPESPPSDKNYLEDIRRWYGEAVRGRRFSTYQGRFLVEERRFGTGVVAVAPYDTTGFTSPDWIGFQWDAARNERAPVRGTPRRLAGDRLRLRGGWRGADDPGLPDEVAGCLDATKDVT